MNILNRSIEEILLTIPGILIALAFHEFAHAFVSDRLGDPTPRSQGRLTLSPLPHIDIIGFILIVLIGFGWAKPVNIDPRHYKNPRRDEMLVSFAGPAMNLILAFIFMVFFRIFFLVTNHMSYSDVASNFTMLKYIGNLISYTASINIVLCLFNLIPIPPLDGFHILSNIIPFRNRNILTYLQNYGFLILIVLIMVGATNYIIGVPSRQLFNWMYDFVNSAFKLFGL